MGVYSGRRLRCIAPIETVSGKLAQQVVKTNASGTGAIICMGVVRKTNPGVNFFAMKRYGGVYKTEASKTAAAQRQAKFRAVSQAAHERKIDPTKKTQDEENFAKQTKYKTMFGYLFHLEWLAYEG